MCYIMKCEWLKNESNYFVTCKYFRLILQPLQTVTNVYIYIYIYIYILREKWKCLLLETLLYRLQRNSKKLLS